MDKAAIRKILVIKMRNIGDVLLTTPVLDNLQAAFPQASICAAVNRGTEAMLAGHPALQRIFVYDRGLKKQGIVQRALGELRFYRDLKRERFDLVLNLTEGDRGALISLLSGARFRVGLDPLGRGMKGKSRIFTHLVPRSDGTLHTVEENLRFVEALGVETARHAVSFQVPQGEGERVAQRLAADSLAPQRFFHAHVTSRWMFKALPPAKAAFLIDRLAELSGLPAVLTCAPEQKELDYLASVLPLLHAAHRDWSGALSLKELGALSDSARFFVGVDSAPMHMAAALEVPVLGIFGPSCVQNWGPWDNRLPRNPYREKNGVQATGRHLVLQDARPCVPCHRDGCNGSKVSDCLNFPDEQLTEIAADFLSSAAPDLVQGVPQ